MSDDLFQEYNAVIASVMDARRRYDEACDAHGAESWPAEQARVYLDREIEHRDHVRDRYDAGSRNRSESSPTTSDTQKTQRG